MGKLYQLDCEVKYSVGEHAGSVAERKNPWHEQLGHLNYQQLHKMVDQNFVTGIKLSALTDRSLCEGCIVGKMQRKPFKMVDHKQSSRKLELVHSDVCGPIQIDSIGGNKYFVTFIDDYSHCVSVYFIKHKSEVPKKFQEFESIVTNETGQKIVKLRTDNGTEYLSTEFQEYLKSRGIQHELTVAYTPQQNGIAERINRTLMESARSMMYHAHLPKKFWAEAIATATYLKNRSITASVKEMTPYERWYGRKPDLGHLRVFGCVVYSLVPDCTRKKLDEKAEKLRFVGYGNNSKGNRLYNEVCNKIITRRDVIFHETEFSMSGERQHYFEDLNVLFPQKSPEIENEESENLESAQDAASNDPAVATQENHSNVDVFEQQVRKSNRSHNPPDRFGKWISYTATCEHFAYRVSEVPEPKTMDEALSSHHAKEWKEASHLEHQSLMDNDTWELVELRDHYSLQMPEGKEVSGFLKSNTTVKAKWRDLSAV